MEKLVCMVCGMLPHRLINKTELLRARKLDFENKVLQKTNMKFIITLEGKVINS